MGSTGNAAARSVIYNLRKLIVLLINSLQTNDRSRSNPVRDAGPASGSCTDAASRSGFGIVLLLRLRKGLHGVGGRGVWGGE